MKLTVSLKGCEFFSYIGLYDFEQKEGNNFSVDVDVSVSDYQHSADIANNIDYVSVYAIVKEVMSGRHELLETVALIIINQVKGQFPQAESVKVSIMKKNPPIGGHCLGSVVILEA